MAEISIIVPVYNVEKYLNNCIDSILNQIFTDYELILVDDGSTDKSGEICDEYEKKDSRIKVIHKTNGGVSSARNTGLDIACGKYIGFVDSDDSIHPRMYEILYDLINKYDADISCCNYKNTYDLVIKQYEEVKVSEIIEMSNIQAINSLYDKNIGVRLVVPWNKLYRKELFNNIRYELGRIHEDEFIAHKLLYKCKKIIYIDNELYYYLQRDGSIMSQVSYKRTIDKLLASSDRMRFCNKIGLKDISYTIGKTYEYEFFKLYREIEENNHYEKEFSNVLRKDFNSNSKILFRLNGICIKEKISWIIFVLNPRLYRSLF